MVSVQTSKRAKGISSRTTNFHKVSYFPTRSVFYFLKIPNPAFSAALCLNLAKLLYSNFYVFFEYFLLEESLLE